MLGDAEPISNLIFVWLFLEQLPENIRNVLMQKQLMDPQELVREADLMWTPNHIMANAVASTSEPALPHESGIAYAILPKIGILELHA